MHKKTSSITPLTVEYLVSSEGDITAKVPEGLPTVRALSPLARRGSKSQRLYSEAAPCRCSSPAPPPPRRSSSSSGRSSSAGGATTAVTASGCAGVADAAQPAAYPALDVGAAAVGEVVVAVDGHRALFLLANSGLRWSYDISKCCVPGVRSESVPFQEILAAEVLSPRRGMVLVAPGTKVHRLAVFTFRRSSSNPCSWHPRQIVIECPSEERIHQWGLAVNAAVAQQARRPRHLLVIINPYGGSKRARALCQSVARPVFDKAGIKSTVIETKAQGHARSIVADMPLDTLQSLDGVVAIGGDGLFHEIINGLLELRHHNDERGAAAQSLRVGHIPAGSTDAVACTINGTRSAFTAAVHIALGDGTPLDVLRIDTKEGHCDFATCMASYGFMGDLMEESERYRWLGPKRYDLVGAKMLAANRAYRVRVSYLPASHSRRATSQVCLSGCELCRLEHDPESPTKLAFREASHHSLARRSGEWRVVEDEFAGIMLVIMPCRSDKSAAGVAKYGHLCDGAVHLVLVRRCSRLQYLRFLLSMSRNGLEAGKVGGYIEVVPAVAVKIEPIGKESRWNVDGELLPGNHITAEVHRGLVEVFARGVEV